MCMQQWHVYEDWTLEDVPRCYYVGKGDDDRILKKKRNSHHTIVALLYGFDRRIVLTINDESSTFEEERRLIGVRHTHPKDPEYNGIGCNRTLGGQGNSGRIVSDETRAKISTAKLGKTPNKVWSQEERDATSKRMSILHKGKKISDEHKEVLHQRMVDPIIKQAMIDKVTVSINAKYENDPEFVKRILESRARGEDGPSPFTNDEIKQIRAEWELVDKTIKGSKWVGVSPSRQFCQKWAEIKNVTSQAVYGIVKRRSWKHI